MIYMPNIEDIIELPSKFSIPIEDAFFIALNTYGVEMDTNENRKRFKLKLNTHNEYFYFAVCVNTRKTPFKIIGDKLFFYEEAIGIVKDIEQDTCDSTYFRRNHTVLTLNSNMRSQCSGCMFCGTYKLEPSDLTDLTTKSRLSRYLEAVLEANGIKDFSLLENVTVCTGCFDNELSLVNHLIMVDEIFREKFYFKGTLQYIGSQLRNKNFMQIINNNIPNFSILLTIECFERRESLLKKEKALSFSDIQMILLLSEQFGFIRSFLYITGLDSLKSMEYRFSILIDLINKMPIIEIFQNYIPKHEEIRFEQAKGLEYFFESRLLFETLFRRNKSWHPNSWENYRGLWYLTYMGKPLNSIRI